MKKLRISTTVTTILGALSVIAIFLLTMALSDIADKGEDLTLEWYITGICIMILGAFTISTFFTIGFLLKHIRLTDAVSASINP